MISHVTLSMNYREQQRRSSLHFPDEEEARGIAPWKVRWQRTMTKDQVSALGFKRIALSRSLWGSLDLLWTSIWHLVTISSSSSLLQLKDHTWHVEEGCCSSVPSNIHNHLSEPISTRFCSIVSKGCEWEDLRNLKNCVSPVKRFRYKFTDHMSPACGHRS